MSYPSTGSTAIPRGLCKLFLTMTFLWAPFKLATSIVCALESVKNKFLLNQSTDNPSGDFRSIKTYFIRNYYLFNHYYYISSICNHLSILLHNHFHRLLLYLSI